MWRAKNFLLHHDNAPAHSAHVIHNFLAKSGMLFVHHAPYSPDLAPCSFWLCLKLKTVMGGHHAKIARIASEHSGGAILEDFPEVAEALEKVC